MLELMQMRKKNFLKAKEDQSNIKLKENQVQKIQSIEGDSLSSVAASFAHEMNNPTAVIMSNLEILSAYMKSFQKVIRIYEQLVKGMKATGDNESQLKDSLKLIEKIKREEDLDFKLKEIDLILIQTYNGARRVKDTVRKFRRVAKANTGKNEKLIVQEILDKLLHPIGEKSILSITAKVTEKDIEIRISDSTKKTLSEKPANPFIPLLNTKSDDRLTDLGLYISYDIIKKYQGTIELVSNLNEVITFIIRLPIANLI